MSASTLSFKMKERYLGTAYKTARKHNKTWEIQEDREIRYAYWNTLNEAHEELARLVKDLRDWRIELTCYNEWGSEVAALQASGWRDATPEELTAIENTQAAEKAAAAARKQRQREEEEATVRRLRKERPELFQ